MTQKLSKLSLSLVASALLAGNALALDPAITNFGYTFQIDAPATIFNAADPTKKKNILELVLGTANTATDPTGRYFYVADDGSGNVKRFNAYTGSSIDTIVVGSDDIILNSDGSKAYVSNTTGDDTVSVIDTTSNTVTATIAVNGAGAIILSSDGSKAYTTGMYQNTVSVIDTATNTVSATIAVDLPVGIILSPNGSKAYVSNDQSNTVSVIDTTLNTVTATIALGDNGENLGAIIISPDGQKVYVENMTSGIISVIDTATNTVVHTINQIRSACGLSISSDGSTIYARSPSGELYAINASDYSVTTYTGYPSSGGIFMGSSASHITFSPNLITGTLDISSTSDMAAKGFSNYVNFAGGTLRATGSFTLSNPVYLHDAFNLTYDDSSTFTTVAGGTVDTNSYNVEFSGEVSGVGGLTKTGAGTLTLSGANTYNGETVVDAGTLEFTGNRTLGSFAVKENAFLNVTGDLTLANNSIYKVYASADGSAGKVVVTGAANLDGAVQVVANSSGTWNTSTDYTILSATGGVTGTFTSVTDDLAFLDPTLTYGANDVMLNLTRNSTTYASKGTNGYSAEVGAVLDNLGTPNAQMQALIDVINGTNDAGAAQMLAQLSGAPLGSLSHLSPTQTRTFAMSLFNRMSGGGASGGIGLASLAFADNSDMATTFRYLADAGAIGPNGFQEPQKIGDAEMWIRVVGGRTMSDGDSSRNIADSTTTTGGLQAGIDKRTGEWMIGGSLGYLRSNSDQSGFDGKTDSYQLGAYMSQDTKEYRLSFNAIGGKYNNNTDRITPTGTASADFDGTALSAEVKAAYKVPLNSAWSMEPTIGGWVQRYAQDAYSESGATGSNLSLDKATFTSQALTTELKLINTFGETKNDKGTFETSLGYTRESGDINAALVGRFSAAPTAGSFSIASAERGRDVLTAMVGGDMTVAANTRLFALVNGNWRENESGYSAVAGVKIGF